MAEPLIVAMTCRAEIRASVAADLLRCVLHGAVYWASRGPGSRYHVQLFEYFNLASSRNEVTRFAREQGFEWVLWLDADLAPPQDLLQQLHETGTTFVGAVVYGPVPPHEPWVGCIAGEELWPLDPDPTAHRLEVDFLSLACALTHRSILDVVFDATDGVPFRGDGILDGDLYFCERARQLGLVMHVAPRPLVGRAADLVVVTEHRAAAVQNLDAARFKTRGKGSPC